MSPDRQDIIGVSAVVRDGAGHILLIKTVKAGWELPGGRVEQGEDFITALIMSMALASAVANMAR